MMLANLARALSNTAGRNDGGAASPQGALPPGKARLDLVALLGVQLAMLIALSLMASPIVYVALYVLPLATLTAFFESVRSFSEHVLPGQPSCETEEKRRFFMDAGPTERFFLSQFDFHYHHVHHLYPNVVTFRVRELHHWLLVNDHVIGFDRFSDV